MSYYAKHAKAQDINAACKFAADFTGFLNLLGKTSFERVEPGVPVKIYKAVGSLDESFGNENIYLDTECEEIPNSKISMEIVRNLELEYLKYRNQTSVEQVGKIGYDVAVLGTNEAMLKQVRDKITRGIYEGIACTDTWRDDNENTTTVGATLQSALANAWGCMKIAYEGEAVQPVYFVNVNDVADYLGQAQLDIQQQFGVNYIKGFLGLGDIIITGFIPQGTVYATAKENMGVYALDMSDAGLGLYTDPSGIIGVKNEPEPENGAFQTVMIAAIACFPMFVNKVIKATIEA